MAPPKKPAPKKKDCDCEKEGQTYSPEQNAPPARTTPDGDLVVGGGEPQGAYYRARMGPDGRLQAGGAEPQAGYPVSRELPDGTLQVGGGDWHDPTAPQFGGPPVEPSWLEQALEMYFGPKGR